MTFWPFNVIKQPSFLNSVPLWKSGVYRKMNCSLSWQLKGRERVKQCAGASVWLQIKNWQIKEILEIQWRVQRQKFKSTHSSSSWRSRVDIGLGCVGQSQTFPCIGTTTSRVFPEWQWPGWWPGQPSGWSFCSVPRLWPSESVSSRGHPPSAAVPR